MSETLLLSDMVGCDSVYRYGKANPVFADDCKKLEEGKHLAATVDSLQEEFGPFSITYGYISPQLSAAIVKYQDPSIPSYHRWDLGAAIDFCAHEWVHGKEEKAPILLAHEIDERYRYSRMITYSESPIICFGTKVAEEHNGCRKAMYENRYVGERKPVYTRYSDNSKTRERQVSTHTLAHPWQGHGYPTYHGGGRQQFEHIRVSQYTLLSDYLYDARSVHFGTANFPYLTQVERMDKVNASLALAGDVIDKLVRHFGARMSIVSGYCRVVNPVFDWTRHFRMEIVPPAFLHVDDVAHVVQSTMADLVEKVTVRKMKSGISRVLLEGYDHA
jgi:hypothetical protein